MKQLLTAAVIIVMIAMIAAPAVAQQVMNPNGLLVYYLYNTATSKAYANSQTDTLPSPSATVPHVRLGGMSYLTLTTYAADSVQLDIYVDYQIRGSTTWTQIAADSLKTTDAGWKEMALRISATEKLPGIDGYLRVRNAFRASDNGVTSATYTQRFNFKP